MTRMWERAVNAIDRGARLQERANAWIAPFLMLSLPVSALALGLGGSGPTRYSAGWVEALGLSLTVRLDALGLVLVGLIGLVGAAVLAFAERAEDAGDRARLRVLLPAFALAMSGLVLADDLVALLVFWEATSVLSFLLVGGTGQDPAARRAARQALAVTGAGGLALLAATVLIGLDSTTSLSGLLAEGQPVGLAAGLLLVIAAATKSAQVPFHGWLPGAMVAPTSVSAYLHSATMVKAGVILMIRVVPVLPDVALAVLGTMGVATAIWGGVVALRQRDLKRLLAYSTVSQLGVMMSVLSVGTEKAILAAVALVIVHALAKAALFLGMGAAKAATGTRDIVELSGLARRHPFLGVTFVIGFASLAGVPPIGGFVAKEAGLLAALDADVAFVSLGIVLSATLSMAYATRTLRLLVVRWGVVASRGLGAGVVLPPAALAAVALALGVATPAFDRVARRAASSVAAGVDAYALVLWPGLTTALGLSLTALVAGAMLAVVLPLGRPPRREAADVIEAILDGLGALAARVGAVTGAISRPYTLGLIIALAGTGILASLVGSDLSGDRPSIGVAGAAIAVAIAGAAIASAAARERIAAAMALGGVGLAMAGLFVLVGAPDLALTQLLVEFVVVVAFVLVFRRLPRRFEASRGRSRFPRAALAVVLGTATSLLLLAATATPVGAPPTDRLVAGALGPGAGKNVVNVILTDIRALDTLAEITVVAVAALGVAALARKRGSA